MALLSDAECRKIGAHYVRIGNPIPGDVLKEDLSAIVGQIDNFLENNFATLLGKIDGKLLNLTNRQKAILVAYVLLRKVNQLPTAEG